MNITPVGHNTIYRRATDVLESDWYKHEKYTVE